MPLGRLRISRREKTSLDVESNLKRPVYLGMDTMSATKTDSTASTPTKTRLLGHCQICEAEQKLVKNYAGSFDLVHHGFRRPGDGFIHGDCYGVGHAAYELSCLAAITYLDQLVSKLKRVQQFIALLENREVTHLSATKVTSNGFVLVEYAVGVTNYLDWYAAIEHRLRVEKARPWPIHCEIKRMTARIESWKLAAVRTVEEKVEQERQAKALRAAERASARQVRAEKVAATKARQEALQAKRQVIMDDFRTQFLALETSWVSATRPAERIEIKQTARTLMNQLRLGKNKFFHVRELKCDDALVTLGLAQWDNRMPGQPWCEYFF